MSWTIIKPKNQLNQLQAIVKNHRRSHKLKNNRLKMRQKKKQKTNHQIVEKPNNQNNKRMKCKMGKGANNQKVRETKELNQKKQLLKLANQIVEKPLLKALRKSSHNSKKKTNLKLILRTKKEEMKLSLKLKK